MKKIFCVLAIILPLNAYAIIDVGQIQGFCSQVVCPRNASDIDEMSQMSIYCGKSTSTCYQNAQTGEIVEVNSCSSCLSGAELSTAFWSSTVCQKNSFSYSDCVKSCPDCTNCISDTTWTRVTTLSPYEKKTTRTCNCGTCVENTAYRCAVGYYGSSTNGTSGCTRCPRDEGGNYGTSPAGSTVVTACYIASGQTFTDATGTGSYVGNCSYK